MESTTTTAGTDKLTTNAEHFPPGTCHEGTIIQFEGGHSTVIRRPIIEVVHELTAARQEGVEFVFLDSPSHGLNGFVVEPSKVTTLIKTTSRL